MRRAIYLHILAVAFLVTGGGCNTDRATESKAEGVTEQAAVLNESAVDTLGLGPIVTDSFVTTGSGDMCLSVTSREYSGDGRFRLLATDASTGEQCEYEGRRFTQRGIPSDDDATVWQLRPDGNATLIYNFLYNSAASTLTFLNARYEPTDTVLTQVN